MSKTLIGGVSKKDPQAVIVDLLKEHLTVQVHCSWAGRLEVEVLLFGDAIASDYTYIKALSNPDE